MATIARSQDAARKSDSTMQQRELCSEGSTKAWQLNIDSLGRKNKGRGQTQNYN
ncbi:hypothetical protein EAG_04298 [Camponotus floridanus]|uniref:Uncharacterized protein n=1 Tax=Camponotus floridanus TaxID=104421 RepID=E2AHS7_CAMFO|nr:hypothetical protein EAG_04298 [Camponotus floridanus]